jgi:transposase
VPRRYQSGEVDYTGGISKCGDRRMRTPLHQAANVMLTRYKGSLKLKAWALAIAKRSTMRKARIALACAANCRRGRAETGSPAARA